MTTNQAVFCGRMAEGVNPLPHSEAETVLKISRLKHRTIHFQLPGIRLAGYG